MRSTWIPESDVACALTTERGSFDDDAAFLARHQAQLVPALSGLVEAEIVTEEDLDAYVVTHMGAMETDLSEDGDEIEKVLDLAP